MLNLNFTRFECPSYLGHSKVVPLKKAIADNVRPGMALHFCISQCTPNAAICEIGRQFWGTKPDFTVYSMLLYQHGISLVFAQLVKKLVCAFVGDSYPTASPNSVVRRAYRGKELEIESWSILSFVSRFMAGAMGLPFMPTNSLRESGMAALNKESFVEIENPFGKSARIGLVSAANPDLTIIHGHAADEYGNILATGPGAEAEWGAFASKEGVVATVEKLVSPDFVRRHSSLVRIPGYVVKAVAVVPYGAHPRGITNQGSPELSTYFDDFDYLIELHEAYKTTESAAKWFHEWILSCGTHDDYLAKLGPERLNYLVDRARPEAWRNSVKEISEERVLKASYTRAEMMVVQASREIGSKVRLNGYKVILAGVGVSNLSAWLARQVLIQEKHPVDVVAEFGFFGYSPPPGDPSLHKIDNLQTATMMTDSLHILGIHASGLNNRCIGVLGAAQIDRYGNINSTMIPDKGYLVGSGGANDVAGGSREVVVVMTQDRQRLVDTVPFITCPGEKVRTLVTDIGVFQKAIGEKEFTLTKVLPSKEILSLEDRVRRVKDKCGWEVKVFPQIEIGDPPEPDDLTAIRLFDPKGYFIG